MARDGLVQDQGLPPYIQARLTTEIERVRVSRLGKTNEVGNSDAFTLDIDGGKHFGDLRSDFGVN